MKMHRRTGLSLGCAALSAALLPLGAVGAEAPPDLGELTVTASRNDTALEDMPRHTTILSREDIESSPAQSIDQLLRTIPGFNFTGVPAAISDPTGWQTKMRGLGNAKVLVLFDGIPIEDPFYLTTQFSRVPLANVDHIEIIRGGDSSLWGSMAVGGVVNIITRQPANGGGTYQAGAGSFGTTQLAASQNFVLGSGLSVNFAASQEKTAGYQTTPSQYLWMYPGKSPTQSTNDNYALTARYAPNADLGGFLRVGFLAQDQAISYLRNGANDQTSPDLAMGLDARFGANDSLSARAWGQRVDFTKYNGATCYQKTSGTPSCVTDGNSALTPGMASLPVINYFTQFGSLSYDEQGASAVWSKRLGGLVSSLQFGADYRRLAASDNESFYTTPASSSGWTSYRQAGSIGSAVQTFDGLFVQAKASPFTPALEITASARYDYWANRNESSVITKYNANGTVSGTPSGGVVPDQTETRLDPSIGVHYDLNDNLAFRGSAYSAFRAPGFNNLLRSYGYGPMTVANPDLKPETMTGWELGTDYRNGGVSLGATVFNQTISNMIATYSISSAAGAPAQVLLICGAGLANCGGKANYYTNDQDGVARGVELEARWEASEHWTYRANYSYLKTYLTSEAANITTPLDTQLAGVPHNTATLDTTWKPDTRFSVLAQLQYIGPLYYLETGYANGVLGPNYSQGSYTIVNASVVYHLDRHVDLMLSGVNLFNRSYQDGTYSGTTGGPTGKPEPWTQTLSMPRSLMATGRYSF